MFGKTTRGFYIGKPEAEAENINGRYEGYSSLFKDFLNIEDSIKKGNFIISGRKGSGKTAYANWLVEQSKGSETLFCELFKGNELKLEEIIQSNNMPELQYEALFEWIILVRLVKMIIDSETGTYLNQYKALKEFYVKNAGHIEIDKYVIEEVLKNQEVNFAPLKQHFGFFSGFKSKMVKAPFYQMITPLRGTVNQMLTMEIYSNRKFYVMFDDLDIGFSLNSQRDCKMLMNLVRVAKRYNTDYLVNTPAKVLLFVRDDISDKLEGTDCDVNKIFSSYQFCINWYEYDSYQRDLKNSLLRQFINRRIALAFTQKGYSYDKEDPWKSFVKEKEDGQRSVFRYVLDFTFYTPRDLISIFKDVGDKDLQLPLSIQDINTLIRKYSKVKKKEICDELLVLYDKEQIDAIFEVLCEIAREESGSLSYEELLEEFLKHELDEEDIRTLTEYSLLVPVDEHGYQYFVYRENRIQKDISSYSFSVPKVIKTYFSSNVWH